jgi:hypothetical protein
MNPRKQADGRNPTDGKGLPEQVLIETYLDLKNQPVLTNEQQTQLLKLQDEIMERGLQVSGLPQEEIPEKNLLETAPVVQINVKNMIINKNAKNISKKAEISDISKFDLDLLESALNKLAKVILKSDDVESFYYFHFAKKWLKNAKDKTLKSQDGNEQKDYSNQIYPSE